MVGLLLIPAPKRLHWMPAVKDLDIALGAMMREQMTEGSYNRGILSMQQWGSYKNPNIFCGAIHGACAKCKLMSSDLEHMLLAIAIFLRYIIITACFPQQFLQLHVKKWLQAQFGKMSRR